MRATSRFLAAVKPRYLEKGAPTGLTGLFTHPSPRPALIYYYKATLEKLKQIPESSVYRQSTEAITKHRLAIVEATKPEGLDAWEARHGERINHILDSLWQSRRFKEYLEARRQLETTNQIAVKMVVGANKSEEDIEWEGGPAGTPTPEGLRTAEERAELTKRKGPPIDPRTGKVKGKKPSMAFEPEPPLTADQIAELEDKLSAGLIEEVINVAEGEMELVDKMVEAKVWEELVETPPEGQWTYFERKATHTSTQKP